MKGESISGVKSCLEMKKQTKKSFMYMYHIFREKSEQLDLMMLWTSSTDCLRLTRFVKHLLSFKGALCLLK